MKYLTRSPEETEQVGMDFAQRLHPGDVIALSGELGVGKTAFSRGVLYGLGYQGRVASPTFSIANEYDEIAVVHFDWYRIANEDALFEIGWEEYLDGRRILLIEWSENARNALPNTHKSVHICYGDAPDERMISIGEDWDESIIL